MAFLEHEQLFYFFFHFRSCKKASIVKHILNKYTLIDGAEAELKNRAIHEAVGERIGDGGLLEGLYEHRDFSQGETIWPFLLQTE